MKVVNGPGALRNSPTHHDGRGGIAASCSLTRASSVASAASRDRSSGVISRSSRRFRRQAGVMGRRSSELATSVQASPSLETSTRYSPTKGIRKNFVLLSRPRLFENTTRSIRSGFASVIVSSGPPAIQTAAN